MDIHVSNLPFKLKEEELKALFEPYGEVESVHIILDHKLRQSKGYGFVKMPSREEAFAAMKGLNGHMLEDRELKMSEARPKQEEKSDKGNFPFWKQKKKPGQKLITFDNEPQPKERKKRRGHGRGTTY